MFDSVLKNDVSVRRLWQEGERYVSLMTGAQVTFLGMGADAPLE